MRDSVPITLPGNNEMNDNWFFAERYLTTLLNNGIQLSLFLDILQVSTRVYVLLRGFNAKGKSTF